MKRLKKLITCFIWRLCPECNSDAPKIDNCKVCHAHRSGFDGVPDDAKLAYWWLNYSQLNSKDNE